MWSFKHTRDVGRTLPASCTFGASRIFSCASRRITKASNARPTGQVTVIALIATVILSACGFQLKGAANYPFTTVYVQRPAYFGVATMNVAGTAAPVVPDVILGLATNGVTIKDKIEDADFAIRFLQVFFDKRVLSLSGGGRAREFELEYRVRYEFVDAKGRAWGEPGEITIRRDFSFAESQALAKEAEERQLVRDMQLDAAAQILRRLQAVKKPS